MLKTIAARKAIRTMETTPVVADAGGRNWGQNRGKSHFAATERRRGKVREGIDSGAWVL
jgi:hypothetical protein